MPRRNNQHASDELATVPAALRADAADAPHDQEQSDQRDVERSSLARWWSIACQVAAWGVTAALLSLILLRLFRHDANYPLIWINSFTFYIYLPAYAVVTWAVLQRHRFLAACSLAIVGFHACWVLPDFRPATTPPRQAVETVSPDNAIESPSGQLRVFYANVCRHNSDYEPLLAEIAGADPDVIVLVEYTHGWYQAIANSALASEYPYQSRSPHPPGVSIGMLSRHPLTNVRHRWIAHVFTVAAELELQAGQLTILALHGPRPTRKPYHDFRDFWKAIIPYVQEQPEPLLVVGDLNVTQHALAYQQLTSGRLGSVHQACGRGYATTWPNGQFWLPPIRIDHALASPQLECLGIEEGIGARIRPPTAHFRHPCPWGAQTETT